MHYRNIILTDKNMSRHIMLYIIIIIIITVSQIYCQEYNSYITGRCIRLIQLTEFCNIDHHDCETNSMTVLISLKFSFHFRRWERNS